MELYDEELQTEPAREIGIATWPPIDTMDGTFEEVMQRTLYSTVTALEDGKFPVALGGEHSLTPPLVSATAKKYKDLCVLHIGCACRDAQRIPRQSRAVTFARCGASTEICPAVQVGVRSLSEEEAKVLPKLRTKVYWAKDIVRAPVKAWIAKVLEDLSPHVYLTVNVDGFDSSDRFSDGRTGTGRTRLV